MRDQSDSSTLSMALPVVPDTIATRRLGDLFIPSFHEDQAAYEAVDSLSDSAYRRSGPSARFHALNRARTNCQVARDDLVKVICERGGLLLCG